MNESSPETLEFDLTLKSVAVVLKEPGTGRSIPYYLRELDGEGRDKYLNGLSRRMRVNPATGRPEGVKDFEGMQASLVSRCLFTEDNSPVPEATIQKWPASVQTALFEKAKQLSGLDEKAEEDAGNE